MWHELPKYSFGIVSNSVMGSEKVDSALMKLTEGTPNAPLDTDCGDDNEKVGLFS